jgi:shikimate kinase
MGAGKTTVGQLLALRCGHRFIDSDAMVEERSGASVSETFARRGEAAFRDLERDAIQSALGEDRIVLATGGGAFVQPETAAALLGACHVVHLRCDFDEAFRRATALGGRPLLQSGENTARELFAARKDTYTRAHAIVDTSRRSPDEVVNDILRLLPSA